jgi:hypothetical protein
MARAHIDLYAEALGGAARVGAARARRSETCV